MNPKVLQLRNLTSKLESEIHEVFEAMLSNVEASSNRPISSYSIYETDTLIDDMQSRKKAISLEDLELQTDISRSTIKRMLKDPSKTSLENFLTVANELGMKIWIEK
ncbi:helix-turn-helix domain-containing protein [Vibrio rhizosphaerae]|uniref:Helix-turn-helix transcriptional regulator n=1 Tax=Vibrio rhizosphaerae TaxID=398736 RepID=A0ABU4IYK9_9VIBR|nr:helix-turn-helix transcriptional regulator [Vibrio rhizosphaerae]MDW6094475.1 helix-turn-helix transcriptional regulator [Vibrio rhizosphaerae]